MAFRLQYASNLFVDSIHRPFHSFLKPAAPCLALLGNIGRPESPKTYHFLKYCARNWDSVFWIPGPHELSNTKEGRMTYEEKEKYALGLTKQIRGVSFMAGQEAVFHDFRIVLFGTSLWTPLSSSLDNQPEFQSIFTSVDEAGPIPLCSAVRNQLHKKDLLFLRERSLFWKIVHPDVNLVYLTQSLPTSHLLTMPSTNKEWSRKSLDCWKGSFEFQPRAWIGGAAACTQRIQHGSNPEHQTACAVNGLFTYPLSSYENTNYDPECVLEIPSKKPSRGAPMVLPRLVLPPLLSDLMEKKVSLAYA